MARGLIAVTSDTRLAAAAISPCALSSRGRKKRALSNVDEVAPVDDRASGFLDLRARARRLRPVAVKRDQLADQAARRGAIVGCARVGESDVHFRNPSLPPDRDDLARRKPNEADQENEAEDDPDDARICLGEQPFDEVGRP